MNLILKAFIICACVLSISCGITKQDEVIISSTENNTQQDTGLFGKVWKFFETEFANKDENQVIVPIEKKTEENKKTITETTNSTLNKRNRRQNGLDDFYTNDFLYDYYDWVCSEIQCQLCNVLTAECCDPAVNVNCFLPDSCLNNPCLSGGTCITTRTIDGKQPDFICVCLPGFTGKYCQLTNEFMLPPSSGQPQPGQQVGPQQSGVPAYGYPQVPQQQPPQQMFMRQGPPQMIFGAPPQQFLIPGLQQAPPSSYGTQQQPAPQSFVVQQQPQPSYGVQQQAAPSQPPSYGVQQQAAPSQPPSYGAQQQAPPSPPPSPPSYGVQQQQAPQQPQYGSQQPSQWSAPSSGSSRSVRSAKGVDWEGFDCNCQGKGFCAQVGTEETSEPEFFCICNDNTYGSRCDEGFRNPCVDATQAAKFAPIDRRIPGYYFVECRISLPYVRKCEGNKRFNPQTNKCQAVRAKLPEQQPAPARQ